MTTLFNIGGKSSFGLPGLFFSADLLFLTSAFYLMGMFFYKENYFNSMAVLLSGILILYVDVIMGNKVSLAARMYGNITLSSIAAIAGIYGTLYLSSVIKYKGSCRNLIVFIGQNTIFIFIFHQFFQNKVFFLIDEYNTALACVVSFLTGVGAPLCLSILYKNVSKRIQAKYGLLQGKKPDYSA